MGGQMGANTIIAAPQTDEWETLGSAAQALASSALRRRERMERAEACAPAVSGRNRRGPAPLRDGGEVAAKPNEVPGCFPAAGQAAAMLDGSATRDPVVDQEVE